MFTPVEIRRFNDPTDTYTVIVSARRYQQYVSVMPGDGGGTPGFITILDEEGDSRGRMPIPMINMADGIEWTPTGANIKLVGGWDFEQGTCACWNKRQDKIIRRKVK